MTYEATLATARVIQRCPEQHAEVLSCRHEVVWPDGTRAALHPVRQHGADALFLRAVHIDGHWLLFDLRAIAKSLAADLPTAPLRDQPGTVLYTLRARFHGASAFLDEATKHQLACWPGSPREAQQRPHRDGSERTAEQVAA